jgi:acetolactate synthase-1/2/3 large subunit
LSVLDALRDTPIRLVVARHEAGAANMADAYGKLTGRPGICLVTRGPGATQASVGIHTAAQDSTPLVLFIGQVPRRHRGREAFQEVDYAQMFGGMAKWVVEVEEPGAFAEVAAHAFHVATSGRPGPVVVALPEDVLTGEADVADASPYRPVRPAPAAADLERFRELLEGAERPFVVVGGGGWTAQAASDLQAWAEASRVPVATPFRRQDYMDNLSPSYAGALTIGHDRALADRLRGCDLLVAIGTRLGEVPTRGYTTLVPPRTPQTFVHVYPDPDELGRVYEPDLAIVADPTAFLAAAPAVADARWTEWTDAAHEDFLASLQHERGPGDLDLGEVVAHLRERLPEDAIVTNGAGNFSAWIHRYFAFRRYGTQLSPCSGAMGYGVPAAVTAKLLHPDRAVVCVAGDGDFLMSSHELAAAVQEGAAIVVLLVNNGMYGTIRMHQERHFPGRVVATELRNPDFVALAEAYGCYAETVERDNEFADALDRALDAGRPALLDLRVDPEAIAPGRTISAIRARS